MSRALFSRLTVLTLAMTLAGCARLLPGDELFHHRMGQTESPGEAPSDGSYALYSLYNDIRPLQTIQLHKGDELGFKTSETGRIIAVAGDDEFTYTDGDYIWKRK